MTTLVYRYGLRPPIENELLVREQMLLGHRYRNTLTEIERARRAVIRELQSSVGDIPSLERAVHEADAAVLEAARDVKSEHASARSRLPSVTKMRLKQAREKRKAAMNTLFEARRALREDPEISRQLEEINERGSTLRKAARAISGVYNGTYHLIDAAAEKSRAMPLYDGAEPNDPRFIRWNGEGSIGVLVILGMGLDKLESDTRLRIEPGGSAIIDRKGRPIPQPSAKRAEKYKTLAVRIGSNPDRTPIFARWPMILDRPLPEGARIKNAAVHCHKESSSEKWYVTITLDTSVCTRVHPRTGQPDTCGAGKVAVDVGWRVIGDEMRVASWVGEEGDTGELRIGELGIGELGIGELGIGELRIGELRIGELRIGELRLSKKDIAALTKASSLREIRDRAFNVQREMLTKWLARTTKSLPPWLQQATKTLSDWRSQDRLARLCITWREKRFDGDIEIYPSLEAWRKQDRHLWNWECAQRSQGLARRKDTYRKFATDLSRRYSTLVLEKFDLRRIIHTVDPMSTKSQNDAARGNRYLAAVSELRLCLEQAFVGRGGNITAVDAVDSTHECHACAHIDEFDAAEVLFHICTKCGERWDQDENAARVLLKRVHDNGEKSKSNEVLKGSRWDRAKAKKATRVASQEGARTEARNDAE